MQNSGIFTKEKIDFIEQCLQDREDYTRYLNFGIFQDKIFSLGEEFIKYISKFPYLSQQLVVLEKHNSELLDVLATRIRTYENLPENYDEIEILINYFTRKSFDIDVSKLEEKDLEGLIECAFINSEKQRDDKTINVEFGHGYLEKLEEEYNRQYKEAKGIEEKKNICLNKRFGMSLQSARRLIEEYAADLDNLDISDENRVFFEEIIKTLETQDEEELDKLFSTATRYKAQTAFKVKHEVSKACAISFVKEFRKTHEKVDKALSENDNDTVQTIEFEGQEIKQIRLTGDFDILVHSTDTGFIREREGDKDFVKQWYTGDDKSNHIISMCNINQDFLGCPPVGENGVMYGFSKIAAEKIQLMGVTDLNTYSREFAYSAASKKYMSSKTLPYNSRRVYDEFGIERQDVKPDYVILFDDSPEEVKQNSYRAASQFGINVIYIDKEGIEKQQLGNLSKMIETFKKTKDVQILRQLMNTYETNVAGWLLNRHEEEDKSFTSGIDNSRFKADFEQIWGEIEDTIEGYISSASKDNIDAMELTRVMEIILEERELYKGTDKTTPISKTAISYDYKKIIQSLNSAFERTGLEEHKIDLENIPTANEYRITMKKIIEGVLTGDEAVTIEDVDDADRVRNSILEKGEEERKR